MLPTFLHRGLRILFLLGFVLPVGCSVNGTVSKQLSWFPMTKRERMYALSGAVFGASSMLLAYYLNNRTPGQAASKSGAQGRATTLTSSTTTTNYAFILGLATTVGEGISSVNASRAPENPGPGIFVYKNDQNMWTTFTVEDIQSRSVNVQRVLEDQPPLAGVTWYWDNNKMLGWDHEDLKGCWLSLQSIKNISDVQKETHMVSGARIDPALIVRVKNLWKDIVPQANTFTFIKLFGQANGIFFDLLP